MTAMGEEPGNILTLSRSHVARPEQKAEHGRNLNAVKNFYPAGHFQSYQKRVILIMGEIVSSYFIFITIIF